MANPIQCCLYLQGWWEVRVEAFVRRTSAWCGLCRYQCRWNVYPLSVTFRLTILQKNWNIAHVACINLQNQFSVGNVVHCLLQTLLALVTSYCQTT